MLEDKVSRLDPKQILTVFNQYDEDGAGLLSTEQLQQLMNSIAIHNYSAQQGKMYTFDDVLSVISLATTPQQPSSLIISFIKMLLQYQKRCEAADQFEEAQKTEVRIGQIRQRQLKRRQQRLKQRHQNELDRLQQIQQQQLDQFTQAWDQHLQEFQRSSMDLMQQMKLKHLDEIEKQEMFLRKSPPRGVAKDNKKIIELKAKEKILIKNKDYNQVIKTRNIVNRLKERGEQHLSEQKHMAMDKRMKELQKHQNVAVTALRDKIYSERMSLLRKRKDDTDCLVVRIRNLKSDVRKKMTEEDRKLQDQLRQQFNLSGVSMVGRK